ncbi:hypothetical protein ACQJBY_057633 [Aegilops geniculata]
MKGSSLVFMVALLCIGYLVVIGQCRLMDGRSHRDRHANSSANPILYSSLDENRLTLEFCVERDCKTKSEKISWDQCMCCLTLPDLQCWRTRDECKANCPACNPKC